MPYGIRSKEHIEKNELISLFTRFAKLIRANYRKLENVYVFTTEHEKYNRSHFLSISAMKWELVESFDNGGISIGLFRLVIEESLAD